MTGWALLGTGPVAGKFAIGLKRLGEDGTIIAAASRSLENTKRFARTHKVPAADSYDDAINAPGVDVVYIALPPAAHEEYALKAIAAGRAVLIEKPMALNAVAAQRIASAAQAAGVFCMEAVWTRFLPMLARTREVIEAGTLGEIRQLSGSFGISNIPDPAASLFDPAQGGGALMHRGFYPLTLARHLLGPITEVSATGRLGETGVDEDAMLILRHDSGARSTITASLCAPLVNDLSISGTHGRLHIAAPVYRPHQARLIKASPRSGMPGGGGRLGRLRESALAQGLAQRVQTGRGKAITARFAGNGYHDQAAEVVRCLHAGEITSPLMPPSESVEIMQVLDTARAALGIPHT